MNSSSDVQFNATREFLLGMTSLELSKIAEPFLQMFDESRHFQIALGVLLPIMNNPKDTVALRLQAAFLLWYLYRNHSLDMNPFTCAFREALQTEKSGTRTGEELLEISHVSGKADTTNGGEAALALTLEIILAGRASELERYSPDDLANHWPVAIERTPRREPVSFKGGPEVDKMHLARRLLLYASEATLSLAEQRTLLGILPSLPLAFTDPRDTSSDSSFPFRILEPIVANNLGNTAYSLLSHIISQSTDEGRECCWVVLRDLQPNLANFDLVTRLLRDGALVNPQDAGAGSSTSSTEGGETVGGLVRRNTLNAFLEHCDVTIERMEVDERGSDGRVAELDPNGGCATAVQNFCRFCLALLRSGNGKTGVVWGHKVGEDEWFGMVTIIRSFALRYVRFEVGSELYGILARSSMARSG